MRGVIKPSSQQCDRREYLSSTIDSRRNQSLDRKVYVLNLQTSSVLKMLVFLKLSSLVNNVLGRRIKGDTTDSRRNQSKGGKRD